MTLQGEERVQLHTLRHYPLCVLLHQALCPRKHVLRAVWVVQPFGAARRVLDAPFWLTDKVRDRSVVRGPAVT